jgi:Kef-type K+ transport system membrane component KefB
MPEVSFGNLFVVSLVALVVPLVLGFAPGLRVPAVVGEIVVGVLVGPSGLGWVDADTVVQVVALLGLAFLLFLAGLEIDVHQLRGPLLRLALLGYLVTLVLGLLIGYAFGALDWVKSPLLLAVTLSATSLGLVVPVLKDSGRIEEPTGQTTIAAASVADFAAVVLLSLLFGAEMTSTGGRLVLLAGFVALVAAIAVAAWAAGRSRQLGDVLARLQDTTAEIRVRAAVVLLVGFVALARRFGLESILGAFLAGGVVGVLDRNTASHPYFRRKLEAIGYGFLIPVFFVTSGLRLDLSGLLASPSALARVPLFLLALLVVRGVPAMLYRRRLGTRGTVAAGLLQATSLPFIVAATQIGVVVGLMTPVTAAALVCAGLASVLVFPAAALALLRTPAAEQVPAR